MTACWLCSPLPEHSSADLCEACRARITAGRTRERQEADKALAAEQEQLAAWHRADIEALQENELTEQEHDDTCPHCFDQDDLPRAERRRRCLERSSVLPVELAREAQEVAVAAFAPWRKR